MRRTSIYLLAGIALLLASLSSCNPPKRAQHNVIIFVADGLRPGSVNEQDAPTIAGIRDHGVSFVNSHSVFPTVTTANASAIATGHYLGDTGDFSNGLYTGQPVFNPDVCGNVLLPFLENDEILAQLNAHYDGDYLGNATLISVARKAGFNTAVVGKGGPTAIQDIEEIKAQDGKLQTPQTIVIDDFTNDVDSCNRDAGVPLSPEVAAALKQAGVNFPRRRGYNGFSGDFETPGTKVSNADQQKFFADATTKVILPMFSKSDKPFVLVYWSRDPDGTQHNEGDSPNKLSPGINGPTSKSGVKDADQNLKQIWDQVQADPSLAASTDLFVTSDHGFATISRHEIDADGKVTASYAATKKYYQVNPDFLPRGFLAIDLAHDFAKDQHLKSFDPDTTMVKDGKPVYNPVDLTAADRGVYTARGSALFGGEGAAGDKTDAQIIVCADAGSDLIYLPNAKPDQPSDTDRNLLKRIVEFLAKQDYTGGIFVDDRYGSVAGTLPMSAVSLVGSAKMPRPAIVVGFKTFTQDPHDLQTAVQIADSDLQEGQGNHGSLGRDNTFNFMAAIGPDFKLGFVNKSPAGNPDIAPTVARILGLQLPAGGTLTGRVLVEALTGGPAAVDFQPQVKASDPWRGNPATAASGAAGKSTVLVFQQVGSQIYVDRGCFKELAAGATPSCP